ncbi:MAG: hypothetical protein HYY84_10275 [Deltaproteobacteria bacterium]|nr:hypothetical protein [Deltaproteobacteria bacterium]
MVAAKDAGASPSLSSFRVGTKFYPEKFLDEVRSGKLFGRNVGFSSSVKIVGTGRVRVDWGQWDSECKFRPATRATSGKETISCDEEGKESFRRWKWLSKTSARTDIFSMGEFKRSDILTVQEKSFEEFVDPAHKARVRDGLPWLRGEYVANDSKPLVVTEDGGLTWGGEKQFLWTYGCNVWPRTRSYRANEEKKRAKTTCLELRKAGEDFEKAGLLFAVLGTKEAPRLVQIEVFEHNEEDGACGPDTDFKLKRHGRTLRRK